MKQKKSIIKKIAISISLLIIILLSAFYIYTLDYYKADEIVKDLISNSTNISIEKNITTISPSSDNDKNIGLIFYPGGKVEYSAYIPLLKQISESGITCFLVEMPFNLAVFNSNAATSIIENNSNFDSWYLMGHSLGGAMATTYSKDNSEKLEGLILLASYPLNDSIDNTISIYGSQDYVLDQSNLDKVENKIVIKGGNHAYFGNYGEQKDDGISTISREEQQNIASSIITNFILN